MKKRDYVVKAFAFLFFLPSCLKVNSKSSSLSVAENCEQSADIPLEIYDNLGIHKKLHLGEKQISGPFVISAIPANLTAEEIAKVSEQAEKYYARSLDYYGIDLAHFVNKAQNKATILKRNLTPSEVGAVFKYTGSGTLANPLLRDRAEGKTFTKTLGFSNSDPLIVESELIFLSSALNKFDSFKGPVFRAMKTMPAGVFEKLQSCLKQKKPYLETAFTATSSSQEIFKNKDFSGEVEMFITSENGRDISDFSTYGIREKEILFQPGSRFCVVSAKKSLFGQKYTIRLTEFDNSDAVTCN